MPGVAQIERGRVSTHDALYRFLAVLGDTLNPVADFSDEQLKIA